MKNGFRLSLPRLRGIVFATAVALGGAACSPTVDVHGNLPHPEVLAQLQPGRQTYEDVLRLLGTPSSTEPFGGGTWYYVGMRTEKLAFFEPEILERKVIAISFDHQGKVAEVKTLTAEDGERIEMVDRETPTPGKEMSILEQLLGNVGRFNKDNLPQ